MSLYLSGQHASATLGDYAILPFARFGGSVLAAGPYAVEVLAKGDAISAYLLDASGKAQGGADFSLKLQLGAGAEHALELKWDAARACYTASFAGDLSAQPLRLSLTGRESGPEMAPLLARIGRDCAIRRLESVALD